LIPKLHKLMHYRDAIERLGSLDGFNSEAMERLHIDYAKIAYRASNRKDHVAQMTRWLERQEAVDKHSAYIRWAEERAGRKAKVVVPKFTEEDGAGSQVGDDELRAVTEAILTSVEKLPEQRS
jgi:hypothetical protein